MLDRADPNIEIVESARLPGAKTYHGRQGVLDALDNWAGQWDDFQIDVERIVGARDKVVSLLHHPARGKLSGAPVELRVAYVHTIKNGKAVRWEMFPTWEEALEAAGLPEQHVQADS
jgi:ketosteroid isomerase-like protein